MENLNQLVEELVKECKTEDDFIQFLSAQIALVVVQKYLLAIKHERSFLYSVPILFVENALKHSKPAKMTTQYDPL